MRRVYVIRDGNLVEVSHDYEPTLRTEIITDSLPPGGLQHPCTGTYISSKSNFRKLTKAHGCVEVGNEKQTDRRQWGLGSARDDMRQTIEQLRNR